MGDVGQTQFRKLVVNIKWLAMNNKPDLCFDAMEVACRLGNARVKDVNRADRIIRKAKERAISIKFNNIGNPKEATIVVMADGSYGKLKQVDSCGGKVIALGREGGKMCPIIQGSKQFPKLAGSLLATKAQSQQKP